MVICNLISHNLLSYNIHSSVLILIPCILVNFVNQPLLPSKFSILMALAYNLVFFLIRVPDNEILLSRACFTNNATALSSCECLQLRIFMVLIVVGFSLPYDFNQSRFCALFYTKFFHNIFYLFPIFNFFY
jgi:hypothetical protein